MNTIIKADPGWTYVEIEHCEDGSVGLMFTPIIAWTIADTGETPVVVDPLTTDFQLNETMAEAPEAPGAMVTPDGRVYETTGDQYDCAEDYLQAEKHRLKVRETTITVEHFIKRTGREPVNDELERCNCKRAGQGTHLACGWCKSCDLPKFQCGCDVIAIGGGIAIKRRQE